MENNFENNSGKGKGYDLPKNVKGWSFGAFALNWVWGLANQTYIALLMFIPFINIIVAIVLGINGKEMAWRNKRWESVEKFNEVQKKWDIAGIIILVLAFIIGLNC